VTAEPLEWSGALADRALTDPERSRLAPFAGAVPLGDSGRNVMACRILFSRGAHALRRLGTVSCVRPWRGLLGRRPGQPTSRAICSRYLAAPLRKRSD
jgi:hypothetical protein